MATVKDKIGQMFVVGFEGKQVTEQMKELIHEYRVGAIILFSRNIGSPEEVLTLTTELQKEAKIARHKHPLLICIDQENGIVRRLGDGTTVFPGAMALGATQKPNHAYDIGVATGRELKALGINWNLAPVLDVNNNPKNPVIGVRSFGESAELVSQFGIAAMKGMQAAEVVTTLKHFPGHGDTDVDSHVALPVITHDLNRLEEIELAPFKACMDANADVVMSAHIHFPEIEKDPQVPATLSKAIITGLLREKLQYDGVVTTDCMEMDAISETIGTERGAVAAIVAGVDLVMISHIANRQIGALKEVSTAVSNGELDMSLIEQAFERVMKLKEKYLSWEDIQLEGEITVPPIIASDKHKKLAEAVYTDSVTIVKNEGILPLNVNGNDKILVVEPEYNNTIVEDKSYESGLLTRLVKKQTSTVDVYHRNSVYQNLKEYKAAIIGVVSPDTRKLPIIQELINNGVPIIIIAMRSPYDIAHLPTGISASIATYEYSATAVDVAVAAIFGTGNAYGKLPVTINV
ncbi:beta-N-acetylhexosaminidase [Evansella cellulosilytica]|uniref:Glycoside hydrolase family 3 domain protein n=1 Tax=Evansella cellulosilytica (strain ATCC 21833 / DSM 2522 / FERM P-1141 / JCM 9156 / N-4) TaxID=649639 RepID=E6TT40_EVAC2|nr:beta-N-acetylhexosaminidase [Evansella cellulosilytica]ADU31948.1 glycoside hydrolase family 3 domain protein [Evansella cellulosilytica DSM 2522]